MWYPVGYLRPTNCLVERLPRAVSANFLQGFFDQIAANIDILQSDQRRDPHGHSAERIADSDQAPDRRVDRLHWNHRGESPQGIYLSNVVTFPKKTA